MSAACHDTILLLMTVFSFSRPYHINKFGVHPALLRARILLEIHLNIGADEDFRIQQSASA